MNGNFDFIAYPFLNDKNKMVDHEILTDKLSSTLGHIISMGTPLEKETWWLMDKVLHLNGSLRGKLAISLDDLRDGQTIYHVLKDRHKVAGFIYPVGNRLATQYHIARCEAKIVTRNLYLIQQSGIIVPEILLDISNLMANILFVMSLEVNRLEGFEEIPFESRSY
ncbi:hypothetical protein [Gudongella sp. DL1XJH-153]|uniref:hypothetical protein n=1 Tax=Gudongella sp. DL1XJH-153 TaxID=3409804 RepID=UPI003BB7ED5B